jgi:hypothetical protein
MSDSDALKTAYGEQVKLLFNELLQAFISAQGDGSKEAAAEVAYKKGNALARHALDRATKVLP